MSLESSDGLEAIEVMLARCLVRYRTRLVLLTCLLLLLPFSGLTQLKFTTSIDNFFPQELSSWQNFKRFEQEYVSSDELLFIVAFDNGEVYERSNLQLISTLTEELEQVPYLSRIRSLTNLNLSYHDKGKFAVKKIFTMPEELSEGDFLKRIRLAREDSLINGIAVSDNGDVTAIQMLFEWPDRRHIKELREVFAFIETAKENLETAHPKAKVYLTGEVMYENSLLEFSARDLRVLFPVVIVIGFLVLFYLVRSISIIIAGQFVVLLAIVATLGTAGVADVVFDQTSMNFVFLVFVVGLADVTHVLTNYIELKVEGDLPEVAMEKSLASNLKPIFVTSLTTMVGFLTLNSCDSPTFAYFGTLAAVGVLFCFFLTLTVLPALAIALPSRNSQAVSSLSSFCERVAIFAIGNQKKIFWPVILFSAICLCLISLNDLQEDIIDYFDDDSELKQAIEFNSINLLSRQTIGFSLDSGQIEGINNPNYLYQLESFTTWLRQQPEIKKVLSYEELIKRLNKNMQGDKFEHYQMPDTQALAAQYLLLYELGLEQGTDLNDLVNDDRSAVRVIAFTEELNNRQIIALEQRCIEWLHQELKDITAYSSSTSIMFAKLGQRVMKSMIVGSLVAIVIIALVMMVYLKSVSYGLLSMVPNALPAVIVYGLWGLFDGQVNSAVAVTFCMSMGIIVDDTVHILSRYVAALRRGDDCSVAISQTFKSTGAALIVTTAVIVGGLSVQVFSQYGVTSTIGFVCAPIITIALIFDFIFLPVLLLRIRT